MATITDPELVEQLLGKSLASLFEDTIEIIPSDGKKFGNMIVGDTLSFKLKDACKPLGQFIVTGNK